jgi:hypothetical protein
MRGLDRLLTAALASAVAVGATCTPAAAQGGRQAPALERQTARATRGVVSGTVTDHRGGPIQGASVSALGDVAAATAVTDGRGFFTLALPAGEYVLRAHMNGFVASPRRLVRVGASQAEFRFELRKLDNASSTAPLAARPIVAAGFDLPLGPRAEAAEDAKAPDKDDHPHTETAWRLRHIKRGILKSEAPATVLADAESTVPAEPLFGRAMDSAGGFATSLFADLPLRGEVNLLTTSALAPGEMLFDEIGLPRGVAYLALGAPTSAGEWAIRAGMSQGDLSSWIVAGTFASRATDAHAYNFGLSYSKQEYHGGNPSALAAVTDGSRNVGELYGFDRWRVSRAVAVEYGARYAHYDYLTVRGLLSPRVALTLEPMRGTRISARMTQRMLAPGAEEFLSPTAPGPWLPPERTFAPLGGLGADDFRVERARAFDLSVEHDFEDGYVIGLRRFYQEVDDQLVTLFGLTSPEGPQSAGHYYVASAGSVDAEGWALRVSSSPARRVRGTVDYSMTRASWLSRGDVDALTAVAPAAVRPESEDLHDLTTSFETDIPETATRVFVLYRINTGFIRPNTELARPGLDARFEFQVNQALPLSVAGTKWEILVAVRNLFRDARDPASVYDELLVVRPPKRVVGGFLVRF